VPGATCLRDVPLDVLDERGGELPDAVAKRARHVLEEVERTFAARTALESGDPAEFGRQMFLAHDSLRSAFEVSVPELDCLVEAASGWEGVFGARLTGAGFGGCTVTLLACDAALGFASHLERAFSASFGRTPTVEFYRADAGPREVPI
jgi:galactokinase